MVGEGGRHSWRVEEYRLGATLSPGVGDVDRFYLVKRGRVRLLRPSVDGRHALVAILGPGQALGGLRDLSGAAGEIAVAGSDAEVWSIDAAHLQQLCAMDPAAAVDLMHGLNGGMRDMHRRVVALIASGVPRRLSETLLTLGTRYGEPCTHGGAIDLRKVTQQDLADLVGAGRSFVSTVINEMKRDGWLGNVGRTICLRDLSALRKAALGDS
jgi:CRP/FNR family cyclic AMP-dependent transcriptional regulator